MKVLVGLFLFALAVPCQNALPASSGMRFVTRFTAYSGNRIMDQGTMTLIRVGNDELIVDENWPGHPIRTAIRRTIDWINSFRYSPGPHESTRAAMPGNCLRGRPETVEKQYLLGFEANEWRDNIGDGRRITSWLAPQLGCFPLVITIEERRPDGTFALVSERRTIAIDPGR